jgi:hypothetical protein
MISDDVVEGVSADRGELLRLTDLRRRVRWRDCDSGEGPVSGHVLSGDAAQA